MEGIIVDYYFALFSSFNPTNFMELLDALEPKVTRTKCFLGISRNLR